MGNWLTRILLAAALALSAGVVYADQAVQNMSQAPQVVGGMSVVGSILQTAIGVPSAPTAVTIGTAGTTSYTYYCVGSDLNGNDTVPSNSLVFATGNATLSATNYNIVTCGGKVGVYKYKLLKADTSHTIGNCNVQAISTGAGGGGGSCQVTDNSTSAGSAYTAQTSDQTGRVLSTSTLLHARISATITTIYGINSPVTMCTTTNTAGAACTNPTAILSPGYPDANYNAVCTCTSIGTNVPIVSVVTKASNSLVLGVNALTAASASCAVIDCNLIHD